MPVAGRTPPPAFPAPAQARDVNGLRAYLREHQRDYAQLGRLGEGERDRVEEEVGAAVRSCSANIDKLQGMLAASAGLGSSPARAAAAPNADQLAHRQGQVLILAERLRSAAALFDRLRSLRYQQLEAAEAARLARLPRSGPLRQPQTTGELHAAMRQAAQPLPPQGGESMRGATAGAQQQQQQIQLENQALQLELLGMSDQASGGWWQRQRHLARVHGRRSLLPRRLLHLLCCEQLPPLAPVLFVSS